MTTLRDGVTASRLKNLIIIIIIIIIIINIINIIIIIIIGNYSLVVLAGDVVLFDRPPEDGDRRDRAGEALIGQPAFARAGPGRSEHLLTYSCIRDSP